MIHGVDTGFLVAAEVVEHASHVDARAVFSQFVAAGDRFAIAPQVLAEFIHVVSDGRRFSEPLPVPDAIRLAEEWWTARDIVQVFPDDSNGTSRYKSWNSLVVRSCSTTPGLNGCGDTWATKQ